MSSLTVPDLRGKIFRSKRLMPDAVAVYRAAQGQTMPCAREIVEWLSFINSQCPECSPSEWPVQPDSQ